MFTKKRDVPENTATSLTLEELVKTLNEMGKKYLELYPKRTFFHRSQRSATVLAALHLNDVDDPVRQQMFLLQQVASALTVIPTHRSLFFRKMLSYLDKNELTKPYLPENMLKQSPLMVANKLTSGSATLGITAIAAAPTIAQHTKRKRKLPQKKPEFKATKSFQDSPELASVTLKTYDKSAEPPMPIVAADTKEKELAVSAAPKANLLLAELSVAVLRKRQRP